MYPLGTQAQDLKFQLLYEGAPLVGATVQLEATANNSIFTTRTALDNYRALAPQVRLAPKRLESDENGTVTFPGSDLVLGGQYNYIVIPPKMDSQAEVSKGSVSIGYRTGADTALVQNTFVKTVSINDVSPNVELVHATYLNESSFNPEGKATLWFNQNIELTPSSVDQYRASLIGQDQAKLFAEGTNESMKVEIDGNKMTLTPVWLKKPNGAETNLQVQFSGLTARAMGSTLTSRNKALSTITVNVFDR